MSGMEEKYPCNRRRSVSEIRELLVRYHQSQLTQAEFVQMEGICLGTLARYLRREKSQESVAGRHGFVELGSFDAQNGAQCPELFRVCLRDGVSVEIHSGFCAGEVARLLSVLAGLGAP
jgi:hypothetical protein